MKNKDNKKFSKWKSEDSNWRFGIFYFNKKDKRLFVPKRYSALGLTLNFGNPISIVFFVLIVIMLLLPRILTL